MEEQASLHLCNLASQYGLPKAREMIAEIEARKNAPIVVTQPEPTPESSPVDTAAPDPETPPTPAPTDPAAQRAEEDANAQTATIAQLKEALTSLGIAFSSTAKKADLLALFIARP